jgi:hypothetical protein
MTDKIKTHVVIMHFNWLIERDIFSVQFRHFDGCLQRTDSLHNFYLLQFMLFIVKKLSCETCVIIFNVTISHNFDVP